jgi:hypothetical protein
LDSQRGFWLSDIVSFQVPFWPALKRADWSSSPSFDPSKVMK